MTERIKKLAQDGGADLTTTLRILTERTTGTLDVDTGFLGVPKALLVCHDSSARKWGPKWLHTSGFSVSTVKDGEDPIAVARALRPDVILIEARLSGSDREKLFRKFLANEDIAAPLFVLCGTAKEVSEALDLNVFDIARKPYDWHLLGRRAKRVVAQQQRERDLEDARGSLKSALEVANRARSELRRTEAFEPVTGLPNRNKFIELTARGIDAARRDASGLAVLTVSCVRFRMILEALGREQANQVIADFGRRLHASLQRTIEANPDFKGLRTAAVANTGIGRFAMMLTCSADHNEVAKLREEITVELTKPATIAGQTIYPSACTGVSLYPDDADDAESLLLRSESAMREAQANGAAFQFFCARTDAEAARRLEIEQKLYVALDSNQLRIAYQPLIDIDSGRLVATEALLRWPQSDGSFISPEQFVPVAEDAGLMMRLGRYVLDEALRQLKAWHSAGLDTMRMAVNVAKSQLMAENFPHTVATCLQAHNVDASFLELELSERGVMSGNVDIIEQLRQLKSLGVSIAIDDFGTGNSAIAYLNDLPADTLKIDRKYISAMADDDGRSGNMAAAIIAIAQKLRLTVVAEGVETAEQLSILQALGCDLYQGFHMSPAVAPDDIPALALENRGDGAI
jgi:predicted signal transduction protein with EAL and GGDEF domain